VVNFDNAQQNSLFSLLGLGGASKFSSLLLLLIGIVPVLIPIVWWWRRSRKQDIAPLADGFMLLKRRLLGNSFPNLAALGAVELQTELAQTEAWAQDKRFAAANLVAIASPNYLHEKPAADFAPWYRGLEYPKLPVRTDAGGAIAQELGVRVYPSWVLLSENGDVQRVVKGSLK